MTLLLVMLLVWRLAHSQMLAILQMLLGILPRLVAKTLCGVFMMGIRDPYWHTS